VQDTAISCRFLAAILQEILHRILSGYCKNHPRKIQCLKFPHFPYIYRAKQRRPWPEVRVRFGGGLPLALPALVSDVGAGIGRSRSAGLPSSGAERSELPACLIGWSGFNGVMLA
jgi:hypothetical protein